MKITLFTALACALGFTAISQTPGESLTVNNVSPFMSDANHFFWDGQTPKSVAPTNSFTSTLFSMGLVFSGIDEGSNLRLASETYRQIGVDFWNGPISNTYDTDYDNQYSKVWSISLYDIRAHINNYANSGYVVSDIIANWPANGDESKGQSAILAPFEDLNTNGIYEPAMGEYPQIKGEQCILFIANDVRNTHTETGGQSIGLELVGMLYSYGKSGIDIVENTFFLNVDVRNKSDQDYTDFRTGIYLDGDIGGGGDYTGFDTNTATAYFYNATDSDPGAYGNRPPSQGLNFFNGHEIKSVFTTVNNPSVFDTSNEILIDSVMKGESIVTTDSGAAADKRMFVGSEGFALNAGDNTCFDVAFPFHQTEIENNAYASVTEMLAEMDALKTYYDQMNTTGCGEYEIGVDELKIKTFQIAPNPGVDIVSIALNNDALNGVLSIYNLEGQKIFQRDISNANASIKLDIRDYPSGMYLVELIQGNARATEKLMVR
jgi:hypothetical protein